VVGILFNVIGVYIKFNDVEYIGYEDVGSLIETQNLIAEEINKSSRYILKNTANGDIMFPANALYTAEIRLTKISEE